MPPKVRELIAELERNGFIIAAANEVIETLNIRKDNDLLQSREKRATMPKNTKSEMLKMLSER